MLIFVQFCSWIYLQRYGNVVLSKGKLHPEEDKTMTEHINTNTITIIPVIIYTIPAPIRGFGWAIRTTCWAAKRFWEDAEEVRLVAWENGKMIARSTGRLAAKAGIELWSTAKALVGTALREPSKAPEEGEGDQPDPAPGKGNRNHDGCRLW